MRTVRFIAKLTISSRVIVNYCTSGHFVTAKHEMERDPLISVKQGKLLFKARLNSAHVSSKVCNIAQG